MLNSGSRVRVLASCTLILGCVFSNTVSAQRPSFDCRRARFPDEFAICRNPDLAELDNLIAAGYGYLRVNRGRLFADQIGIPFWRLRQACQSNIDCIRQRQVEELAALQAAGAPGLTPDEETRTPTPIPLPSPNPVPEAQQEERHTASSGTGFFVADDGRILTNAHVVRDCSEIKVSTDQGNYVARLVASDTTNDLSLLKVAVGSSHAASLRLAVRLGENVEAFGYPLSRVLATTGNFTTGNVTALAGIGDDSRFLQISAPVQPGNSGGPLLDENGNLIGIVSSKLDFLSEIKGAGDIPQNVNFAIKASVAANFLLNNNVKIKTGDATQPMKAPDLADQAKAMSVFIECR